MKLQSQVMNLMESQMEWNWDLECGISVSRRSMYVELDSTDEQVLPKDNPCVRISLKRFIFFWILP